MSPADAGPIKPRRPWVAAILGLLVPGLGHLYAGRPRLAALAFFALYPLGLALFVAGGLFGPPLMWIFIFVLLVLATQIAIPFHAAVTARRADPGYRLRVFNRWYYYLAAILFGMLCMEGMFRVLHANVGEAFKIPSATMEPTLLLGDRIYVAMLPVSRRIPHRDSLIVFPALDDARSMFVKRTVGLPGDTLAMRDAILYGNGRAVIEPYSRSAEEPVLERSQEGAMMRGWQTRRLIGRDTTHYAPDYRNWGPFLVPPDSCFVLGDNRSLSYDSRHYGFVPITTVRGRPRFIYFSRDSVTGIRWARIGQGIR